MNYPFYKHKDIKRLYLAISVFAGLFIGSLIFNLFKIRLISELALVLLIITLVGHEIIIVLLDKKGGRK